MTQSIKNRRVGPKAAAVVLAMMAAPGAAAQEPGGVDPGAVLEIERRLDARNYAVGPVDGRVTAETEAAIRAYQRDWSQLETGVPTRALADELVARAEGAWHAVADDRGCRVWNQFPQAEETAQWTGPCVEGIAEGDGELIWRYLLDGAIRTDVYSGGMRDGRQEGFGSYRSELGWSYEGGWRGGAFHGCGLYKNESGELIGEFDEGAFVGRGSCTTS